MVKVVSYKKVEGKDRIEDKSPNNPEKKKFEKHISGYLEKIRRCNTYWSILREMKAKKEKFITSYNIAPCFWSSIQYAIQMVLVTDIVSFLSNDEASLYSYFPKIQSNKDKIFTRKFYVTWRNEKTNGEEEKLWENQYSNEELILQCSAKLAYCMTLFPKLKNARDKVYCHLDKKSLDTDICNIEFLNQIKESEVESLLDNISWILKNLNAIYTCTQPATNYANEDDVRNVLCILDFYDKNYASIMEMIHRKEC